MEDTSTKAISFAIGIFVTMIIVTLVVASFSKIKEAYTLTKNTDIDIHSQFDSLYLTYDGKELNGMGLLNTVRRFEDDINIVEFVDYPGRTNIKNLASTNGIRESEQLKKFLDQNKLYGGVRYKYENEYRVEVKDVSGKTRIKFVAK
jgi:hypothetical protein